MNSNTSTSQKIGWVVFTFGVLYMLGLGWFYSWWMVPAANLVGGEAYSGFLGIVWSLSVPLGAFIVAIGAGLIARVGWRGLWLLALLAILTMGWQMIGTSRQIIPALFGAGGGLITLFFLGSTYQWARTRPTRSGAGKTGSDLRMVGSIFFVLAAWNLCGIFGVGNFVLRPDLAAKYAIPIGSTISAAHGVQILLVLGWGFTYFGQLLSRQVQVVKPTAEKVPQVAVAD